MIFQRTSATDDGSEPCKTTLSHMNLLVLGSANVGKTTLINTFLSQSLHLAKYTPTIESTSTIQYNKLKDKLVLSISEVGGDPNFRALLPSAISTSDAFILVYDVGDLDSLKSLLEIYKQIIQFKYTALPVIPITIVGTMVDTVSSHKRPRQVSTQVGQEFAELLKSPHVETTGKAVQSVAHCFLKSIRYSVGVLAGLVNKNMVVDASIIHQPISFVPEYSSYSNSFDDPQMSFFNDYIRRNINTHTPPPVHRDDERKSLIFQRDLAFRVWKSKHHQPHTSPGEVKGEEFEYYGIRVDKNGLNFAPEHHHHPSKNTFKGNASVRTTLPPLPPALPPKTSSPSPVSPKDSINGDSGICFDSIPPVDPIPTPAPPPIKRVLRGKESRTQLSLASLMDELQDVLDEDSGSD